MEDAPLKRWQLSLDEAQRARTRGARGASTLMLLLADAASYKTCKLLF